MHLFSWETELKLKENRSMESNSDCERATATKERIGGRIQVYSRLGWLALAFLPSHDLTPPQVLCDCVSRAWLVVVFLVCLCWDFMFFACHDCKSISLRKNCKVWVRESVGFVGKRITTREQVTLGQKEQPHEWVTRVWTTIQKPMERWSREKSRVNLTHRPLSVIPLLKDWEDT